MVIASIAYRRLPEEKRKAYVELLKDHPDFSKWMEDRPETLPENDLGLYLFMRASTWPDEIRNSRNPIYEPYHHPTWHFIEIPLTRAGPNPNHLSQKGENILDGIEQSERVLSDASKPAGERAIYLSWLIHLIGDVHQPLHCASMISQSHPAGDRGGNMVYVRGTDEFGGGRNLHATWDSLLGGRPNDLGDIVIALNTISKIPSLSLADLASGTTPKDWAEKSAAIAFDTAYLSGALVAGSSADPVPLSADYMERARSAADRRAALAGVILADTLKDLKAPTPESSPSESASDPWLEFIKQHKWLFSVTALALLLMVVLSTRLILILLKLDLWGLKQIAPAVYLFVPFARWKLYRGYRKRLRTGTGLTADLRYGVEHYIDLPYMTDGAAGAEVKLSDLFTKLPLDKRVVVEADGGRGKSTLCYYLTRRCVERRDLFGGKLLEPVVVDGLTYTGNMLQAVTGALSKDRAYVNETIVDSQLGAGNLLVIFEGFSEVRDAYLGAASSGELLEFVRRYSNTPFIFTSRSGLPPALWQALAEPLTVRLCDVDETTEREFLSQYLKRGAQEVDSLMKQVKERFNDLPRIPLMLKLVAAVYDKKGQVPKNTAALFHEYTKQVLREEATGIKFTSAVQYAINHLVRETYLRSGGDRGFTEDRGIELLRQIKNELEDREIKLSPIGLLDVLIRAGLYKHVGRHLKFFHDSFESYFGARALESDFSDGKYELLKQSAGNERLSETWCFLSEMLEAPDDKRKLEELLGENKGERARAAYLQAQRDPGVDCYLQIARRENGYAGKLTTARGVQPVRIDIGPQELVALAKEIRREMRCIAEAVSPDGAVAQERFNDCLPHAAKLGYFAFRQIFSQTEFLKNIREQMLSKQGGSIQIATDSFFFPWELLYPVSPADALTYENFWGLNYDISRLVVQSVRHEPAATDRPPGGRPALGLFADQSIADVREQEIPFFRKLAEAGKLDLFELHPPASDPQGVPEAFKDFFAHGFDLIHFACRVQYDEEFAVNSRIYVADNLPLKLLEIESQDMVISGAPLIVLNTAEGGNLDPLQASGFAATFLSYGARGVVATECVIPALTAPAFTEELYTRLLAGAPLGASLLAVRRALWTKYRNPVGLLYALYAPPSLNLTRQDGQNPHSID